MLMEEKCGWWVAPTPGALAEALRIATSLSALERSRMGDRGRKVVQERFGWPKIAEEMLELYRWVIRGGARPGSVRADQRLVIAGWEQDGDKGKLIKEFEDFTCGRP